MTWLSELTSAVKAAPVTRCAPSSTDVMTSPAARSRASVTMTCVPSASGGRR